MIKLFADEEINNGRQIFLDIAKVVAIFGMILIHVCMGAGEVDINSNSIMYIPIALLGGVFAAPVFMFAMGVGIAYSKRSTPAYNLHRGLELTIKAWLLNIVRLPLLLAIFSLFITIPNAKTTIIFGLSCIDILHFAGLAFICFALFKKLNFSAEKILIISIILAIIGSFYRNFNTGHLITDIIAGLFVGISKTPYFESSFPLFHWLIFVAGGYYFAGWLKRCNSLDKFFKYSFSIVLPLFIVILLCGAKYKLGMFDQNSESYYHMTLLDMFFSFVSIFLSLSVCYFISKILHPKILEICSSISKNINEIYIQQWIYIGWFVTLVGVVLLHIKFSLFSIFVITIIILVVSELFARLYKSLQHRNMDFNGGKKLPPTN